MFKIFNFEQAVETITVHAGMFHADDAACVALLKLQFPDVKVIRTNNPDVKTANARNLIADVGRQHDGVALFDHHQMRPIKDEEIVQADGSILLKKGTPKEEVRAAVGLLWDAYGKKDKFPFLTGLIHAIDLHDTGVEWNPAWTMVRDFAPNWDDESKTMDDAFNEAVEWITPALVNAIRKDISAQKAREELEQNAQIISNSILIMDKFLPWQDFAKEHGIRVVIFPGRDPGSYNIQLSDPALAFPRAWLDEKPEGITFVANWLKLAAAVDKPTAIKIAEEAIKH